MSLGFWEVSLSYVYIKGLKQDTLNNEFLFFAFCQWTSLEREASFIHSFKSIKLYNFPDYNHHVPIAFTVSSNADRRPSLIWHNVCIPDPADADRIWDSIPGSSFPCSHSSLFPVLVTNQLLFATDSLQCSPQVSDARLQFLLNIETQLKITSLPCPLLLASNPSQGAFLCPIFPACFSSKPLALPALFFVIRSLFIMHPLPQGQSLWILTAMIS